MLMFWMTSHHELGFKFGEKYVWDDGRVFKLMGVTREGCDFKYMFGVARGDD